MSSHSLSQESQRSTQEPRKSPSSTQLASGLFNGGFDCEREYAESERSAHSEISSSRHETRNKKDNQRSNEWEIIEGLKEGQTCESVPCKCEGYLLKRRKWPLKGWHKRYFCLDRGILTYAKSPTEMAKGKAHGSIDVGLSVISTKLSSRRIDIDAEEYIYHIKIKNKAQFLHWVAQLKHHRLYRQHEIAFGSKLKPHGYDCSVPVVGVAPITSSPVAESKVANWILDFSCGDLGKELADLQVKLVQLSSCLQSIELQLGTRNEMPDVETGSFKKYRRRFLLRRHKKSGSVTKANDNRHKKHQSNLEIIVSSAEANCDVPHGTIGGIFPSLSTHLSTSHTSLNEPESELQANTDSDQWMMTRSFTEVGKGGSDMGSANNLAKISQEGSTLKSAEDFINLAGEILRGLRSSLKAVQSEKEMMKTKQLSEVEGSTVKLVASLQQSLQQVMNQNYELKQKLMRIHEESEVTSLPTNTTREASASSATEEDLDEPTLVHQPIGNSKSYESSSVLSISEYFDAAERLSVCTTSSEDEDDGSFATDASEDDAVEFNITSKYTVESNSTGRRSKLPAPKPDLGDISLWSLLYKNIGKDLSKICMPVILNEPLNALQRLCEELEYSELLDKAASIYEPIDRMIYVAAFAVSAYGSSCYRAGHKPFNPLLGETYECVREDKGFRFISEQVSHHPPVSACHAESENYVFWQDIRIKSKFWGKSMEVIPCGTVHLLLKRTQSHYRWNKVTTCVHNIFKGQRWVDQYGEMTITDDDFRCKLTFMKASYWNNKRHEICGVITSRTGEVLERIYGKWNEALYCGLAPNARCIWRPAAIPYDHELFYGFTRFAIELNELHPDMVLPPTDTRFRPDQRLLEEGKVQLAECVKMKLEQRQRERRKRREEAGDEFKPLWFKREMVDGEETWIYNGEYWKQKENGFEGIEFESLWPSEILDGESN